MRCRQAGSLVLCFLLSVTALARVSAEDLESVEGLFERSGGAYREWPLFEVTLKTSVEIPEAEPGERQTRYVLGPGRQAIIEIGPLMRILVTEDRVFVEHLGVADRFLEVPVEGDDLGGNLATARGRSSMAGFWEPPQAALRAGKNLAGVLESFRHSRLLDELILDGMKRLPDDSYEVRMKAANGRCLARFDPLTFHLTDVEWTIEPPNAPAGYVMKVRGQFTTQEIAEAHGLFEFEPHGRLAVQSIRELAAQPPGIDQPPEEIVPPPVLEERLMGVVDLASALKSKRVLLVGEEHLTEEIPEYTSELLENLNDRPMSLLLEMPRDVQPAIDDYLETGDEGVLTEIFSGKPILQLQHLLRWSFEHRDRVLEVRAFDEPLYEIFLKRAFLTDTRNVTMSRALHTAWREHPDRRIVAYAGQLHLMKQGRYRVNLPSRDTAGVRLRELGVPPEDIAGVMINGGENFHLHSIWSRAGALPMDLGPIRIPIAYLIDYPIFGAEFADEIFDYFVNVGPLTQIEVKLE